MEPAVSGIARDQRFCFGDEHFLCKFQCLDRGILFAQGHSRTYEGFLIPKFFKKSMPVVKISSKIRKNKNPCNECKLSSK